jgi:hypothetical protein
MRSRTALAALACAAAVAVTGLAGCGGDDDGSAALSRDEFVTQANAICAAGNAKIEAAVPENATGPPSGDAGERFYETIVDETQGTVDGIAALEPPDEITSEVDAMVAAAREVLTEMRATPADEFFQTNEDPFAEVNEVASSLGLDDCAT